MARLRKSAVHPNHERWLVSYADFVTLLFAFFVVMFASGQRDISKAKRVSEAVEKAFNGHAANSPAKRASAIREKLPPRSQFSELIPSMDYLSKELSEEIRSGKMKLSLETRGLVISLSQATFFPSGGDSIDPSTFGSIDKVANAIRTLPNPVRLEGHTDSIPIHTARFRSNWELSAGRSIAMLELLHSRYQIALNRLAVAGYAETVPLESNDSEAGRGHNRRVDIVILSQQGLGEEPSRAAAKVPGKQ